MMKYASAPRAPKNHSAHEAATETPRPQGAFSLLQPKIQRAITANGYVDPTPIQEQCIPHLLNERDVLGTAQTGTGKTAAFTLPMLDYLSTFTTHPRRNTPRALILAPTRELAAQIGESIRTYGRFLDLEHTVIFGGVSQHRQVVALDRGVDILVATPGRLLDLINQGIAYLDEVSYFVLDEVDRMLDMGFLPDMKRILAKLPKERQTAFFSATMTPKIEELANSMIRNPVRVSIAPDKPVVERIGQKVYFVGKRNKDSLLVSLLDDREISKVVVFTQMKHVANKVVKKLDQAGIRGAAIHGNKSQGARTKALDGFKNGGYRVLVATDVAARGLDVSGITHVVNYDLPTEAETYVHRIGRTARAGTGGDAISFCCAEEREQLGAIERLLGKSVPAELEHPFHCDESFRTERNASPRSAPRRDGKRPGNASRRGGSRRPAFAGSSSGSGRSRRRNAR